MEHTDAAGMTRPFSRAACAYFTPYHTVEVWDQPDYKQLRRMWLTDDGLGSAARLSVGPAAIPVLDIPAGYQAGPNEVFDMEYVDGLAYAIPMRYPNFAGYSTDTVPGPQNRDDCGFIHRRYKGRLVNERSFSWHSPDNGAAAMRLATRRARVEVWQYHRAAGWSGAGAYPGLIWHVAGRSIALHAG